MTAEQMIHVWAAKRLGIDVETIDSVRFEHEAPMSAISVRFEHEDGYGNDSGAWWPEYNGAFVRIKGGQTKYLDVDDGFEGIPALLHAILEANT